jgi:hypothetical protein
MEADVLAKELSKDSLVTLTKKQIAIEQMQEGIRMYLAGKNPIATYTVAYSAFKVIFDLCKKKGIPSMIMDESKKYLKVGFEDVIAKLIINAGNFFKHADNDPEGKLEFHEIDIVLTILDSIFMAKSLWGIWTGEMASFYVWFMVVHQKHILLQNFPEPQKYIFAANNLIKLSKSTVDLKNMFLEYIPTMEKYLSQYKDSKSG